MDGHETTGAAAEAIPDIPTRIRTGLSAGFATSLKIISITDHDTTGGLDEAFAQAARYPHLRLIPGIELSAESNG